MQVSVKGARTKTWPPLVLHGHFQAIGISTHVQHMAAKCQPVNHGCYHCGILKQIRPLGKWQICGHNGTAFLTSI